MAQIENIMKTTKEQVKEKVLVLYDDYRERMEKSLDRVLNFGKIDFDSSPDNWQLPKEIMQAIARDMERYYKNPDATRSDNRRVNKIENTIIIGHLLNL